MSRIIYDLRNFQTRNAFILKQRLFSLSSQYLKCAIYRLPFMLTWPVL
jgi:hypothetical protein